MLATIVLGIMKLNYVPAFSSDLPCLHGKIMQQLCDSFYQVCWLMMLAQSQSFKKAWS